MLASHLIIQFVALTPLQHTRVARSHAASGTVFATMFGGCFKRCVSSGAPQLLGRKHGSSALVREHPVLRGGGGCACMSPHGDVCRMAGCTGPRAWLDLWLGLVIS